MTKDEYLVYRNTNSIEPLYEYYKTHATKDLMDRNTFFSLIQQWSEAMHALNFVYNYYDVEFEVTKIMDLKTGQILKCI